MRQLADALRARGLNVRVDAVASVAVLTPLATSPDVDWRHHRAAVLALARAHGFARVALEISSARPE